MSPDVFVLVPSYNHAPYIEECLRSIIGQTVPPKKLLVIDDGSSDDSPELIAQMLAECPFDAELIARENRGLCRTLNQGLELSSGKYFAYLGSDDFWSPTFIEARSNLMESRDNAVLAYGHAHIVDETSRPVKSTSDYTNSWANYPDGNAREMLKKGHAPISSTVFYRRSVIESVGWNVDSRLEDYEMYLRLMNLGDFAFDPLILSAWRDHGYNTSKDQLMMLDEIIAAQDRNIGEFGIDRSELNEMQTATRFMFARDLLQHGEKAASLRLAKENWRGATSNLELIKYCVRQLVPMSVVNTWRQLK